MYNIENFYSGILDFKDKIAPTYINNKNPKYLEIDGKFYNGIIIVDYYREYTERLFKFNHEYNIYHLLSFFLRNILIYFLL